MSVLVVGSVAIDRPREPPGDTLEVGKYANLVVTTGDLLEVRSDVRFVFVEGKQIPLVSRQTEFYERYRKK